MAALLSEHRAWLDRHVEEWTRAGLVSDEQADAIREYEDEAEAAVRLPIVAEVAAYLGGVLAIMAGSIVVGRRWDDLTVVGRFGLGVAIAAVGFVAGSWLVRLAEPGSRRLGSALWLLAAAGVGLSVWVAGDDAGLDPDDGSLLLLVGPSVLAVGLVLWRNLDRPLQLLTAIVGAGLVLGGLGQWWEPDPWQVGTVVWVCGVLLGTFAFAGVISPRPFALASGSVIAWFGAMMLMDWNERWAPVLAAVTAATAVAAGTRDGLVPVLVLGVLEFLGAIEALLSTTLSGAGSASVVAVLGLLVVGLAVTRARARQDT